MLFAVLPLTAIATVEGVVEELRSPFYNVSCEYEKQAAKIKLELRMKSEDVKKYSGYEIKLYALTASQSVEDIPKLLPVVSGIKPSNRTGAEVKGVDLSGGQYDLICANIVADIIIRMAPDVGRYMKEDAVLLASGIITERAEEVIEALNTSHLKVTRRLDDNGWCALVVQKA